MSYRGVSNLIVALFGKIYVARGFFLLDQVLRAIRDAGMPASSVVTGRNRDCLACRIVSGCGLIGAGLYVCHHSKKFNRNTGKTVMFSIAGVLVTLGAARMLDLPPFQNQFGHG